MRSLAALLAGLLVAESALAQQTPLEYQEQKVALAAFHARFVAPVEACAGDQQAIERIRSLVGAMRAKYPRSFDVVERHPVYVTTVREARAAAARPKAPAPAQVCTRGISVLEAALQNPDSQKQYDQFMRYLFELLS